MALTSAVAGCLTEANDPDETDNVNGNGNDTRNAGCPGSTTGFDRRVILHSLEAPDSPDRGHVPACLGESGPRQEHVEWTDEGPLGHTLEPGETGTDDLLLVDDPSAESCFTPGEYRFETTHAIDGTEFSWWFTVEVINCPGGDNHGSSTGRRYEECPRICRYVRETELINRRGHN